MAFAPQRKDKPGISLQARAPVLGRRVSVKGWGAALDRGKALRAEILQRVTQRELVGELADHIGALAFPKLLTHHSQAQTLRLLEDLDQHQPARQLGQGV